MSATIMDNSNNTNTTRRQSEHTAASTHLPTTTDNQRITSARSSTAGATITSTDKVSEQNTTTSTTFVKETNAASTIGRSFSNATASATTTRTNTLTPSPETNTDIKTSTSTRTKSEPSSRHSSTLGVSSSSSTIASTGTSVIDSHSQTGNCSIYIGITVGVSVVVVVAVILVSIVCFLLKRRKWIEKIKDEQRITDLWSATAYSNTIINDNFMDYQLASPANIRNSRLRTRRKSSKISDQSNQISQGEQFEQGAYPDNFEFDSGTLRRNTYSAPDGLARLDMATLSENTSNKGMTMSAEHARTLEYRARASTFTGKRNKLDRHVLLSHEELIEETIDAEILREQVDSSIVTEL
ncbi:uncharacterized protein LOC128246643 [Mya arenaria]|uniref:uncharacterized protein LOC128246643 n=1 Tax=Mya arenaria TaxID=6604 RepID=UPI0022E2F4E7|nr:uncharacterized protein LOC128246643 [Mya arenaria]